MSQSGVSNGPSSMGWKPGFSTVRVIRGEPSHVGRENGLQAFVVRNVWVVGMLPFEAPDMHVGPVFCRRPEDVRAPLQHLVRPKPTASFLEHLETQHDRMWVRKKQAGGIVQFVGSSRHELPAMVNLV